jgi:hypothetical protein
MPMMATKVDRLAAIHQGQQTTQSIATSSTSMFENQDSGVSEPLPVNKTLDFLQVDGITPRKRKRAISQSDDLGMGNASWVLMSTENLTLDDFWQEYAHGRNGKVALRQLEVEGIGW